MSDEISGRVMHSVFWGCNDARDVIRYAAGTAAEAEHCRDLLGKLHKLAGDDRFTYLVRDLTDEEYAEEIADMEGWEADLEELDDVIGRLELDIVGTAEDAKRSAEDEISEIVGEIVGLAERVAAKKVAIADIDLMVREITGAKV